MVQFDDDEGELLETFNTLRVQIVRVSSAFGARLGVRLRALSAARDQSDPLVVEVFGATVVDALDLMSAPLSRRPADDGDEPAPETPSESNPSRNAPSRGRPTSNPETESDDDS